MEYTVSISTKLDDAFIADILDAAGYGIAYWAEAMELDPKGFVRITPVSELVSDGYRGGLVSYAAIAHTVAKVAGGGIARSDLTEHARRAILDNDAGEVDSELGDVIVQVAMFGRIVFG